MKLSPLMIRCTLFLLFLFTLPQQQLEASPDPRLDWKMMKTEHFNLIFPSSQTELAKIYATTAEQVYRINTPYFNNEAPEKTALVLDDSTDLSNGAAAGWPYPIIYAYPVLPGPGDSVNDFADWTYSLLSHEYTHILTFEPAHGFAWPLRRIFGSIIRPNMFLPRWYLEGVAVYMETRVSQHGRLRSTALQGELRNLVYSDQLENEDIARINEVSIPDHFNGLRPYLLGGALWTKMTQRNSQLNDMSLISQLNQDYSARFPYFINGPVENLLDADYSLLFEETKAAITENAQQVKQLAKPTSSHHVAIDQNDNPEISGQQCPVFSPDGHAFAFINESANDDDQIILNNSYSEQSSGVVLASGSEIHRLAWLPDQERILFDQIQNFNIYNQYSDLFTVNIKSHKTERLTTGARAREGTISPDGQYAYFIQFENGRHHLSRLHFETKKIEKVYSPTLDNARRLSWPEFIAKNELVLTQRMPDGRDQLIKLSINIGNNSNSNSGNSGNKDLVSKPQVILRDYASISYPKWTSKGLLFTSDSEGIENIYLADPNFKKITQLTRSLTRAFSADLNNQEKDLSLAWIELEKYGPRVHRQNHFNLTTLATTPSATATDGVFQKNKRGSLPQMFSVPSLDPSQQTKVKADAKQRHLASLDENVQEYSPWSYLVPHYWLPYVMLIPGGGVQASASTSSFDPLNRHAYSIAASTDSQTKKFNSALQYTNATHPIIWQIEGVDQWTYLLSSGSSLRNTSAGLGFGMRLPGINNEWRAILSGSYGFTESTQKRWVKYGPRATLTYQSERQRGFQISPEKGGTFSLSHTRYLPGSGAYSYPESMLMARTFISGESNFLPSFIKSILPKHHVVALSLNGLLAPQAPSVLLGQTTRSVSYGADLLGSSFLMRGYLNASFIGRNMLNSTVEYRFPISYQFNGWGTLPFFFQKTHAALFADLVHLDGVYYNVHEEVFYRTHFSRPFLGVGGELRIDSTLFYVLPVRWSVGLYYGTDKEASLGLVPFLGLSL